MVRLRTHEGTDLVGLLVQRVPSIVGLVGTSVDRKCLIRFAVGALADDTGRYGRADFIPSSSSRALFSFGTSARPSLAVFDYSDDRIEVSPPCDGAASRRIVSAQTPQRDRRRSQKGNGARAGEDGVRHIFKLAPASRGRGSCS